MTGLAVGPAALVVDAAFVVEAGLVVEVGVAVPVLAVEALEPETFF